MWTVRVRRWASSRIRSTRAIGAPTTAATDVATGDLPGREACASHRAVVVQSDFEEAGRPTRSRDGAARARPRSGAHLAFATAFNGDSTSRTRSRRCVRSTMPNVRRVDDISYFNEPFFQNGPIAERGNAASQAGVAYFSRLRTRTSLWRQDVSSYEAPAFRATSCPASVPRLNHSRVPRFDTARGIDNGDGVTVPPGAGFAVDAPMGPAWAV